MDFSQANFEGFGYREMGEASTLLDLYSDRKLTNRAEDYFYDGDISIGFNHNSGYVFITNEDYQVLMDNGGKLDLFITLPYNGDEGFFEDLAEMYDDLESEDKLFLREMANKKEQEKYGMKAGDWIK